VGGYNVRLAETIATHPPTPPKKEEEKKQTNHSEKQQQNQHTPNYTQPKMD